ncbi:MAG: hypothetical protein QF492_03815 [Candidatus Krumholzibacteria bacterium]|nr:hypothetical protein [Candidatus Krumholzibacteria bacterium]MDP6669024.1 hypothetical protein [Candidatus Krumholzibacteria bacterium]MDP7020963.1 hypothetical protein [Candidatus Krumholzibacteria bacterium]
MMYRMGILCLMLLLGLASASSLDKATVQEADSLARVLEPALERMSLRLAVIDELPSEDASMEDLYALLAISRSYSELQLFKEAGEWFTHLENQDRESLFSSAVSNGRLACALGLREDDQVKKILLSGHEADLDDELIGESLALLFERDQQKVCLDILDIYSRKDVKTQGPAYLLQRGRILRNSGHLAEASFHYESLLNALKVPGSLAKGVAAHTDDFLQGAADCAFLMNERLRARRHYGDLLGINSTHHAWARFQLAQLDMLDNGYGKAESAFESLEPEELNKETHDWASLLQKHSGSLKVYDKELPDHSPRGSRAITQVK